MFKNIAIRGINAENKFIDSIKTQFGFNQLEAEIILAVYRLYKIVKIDCITGQYTLSQGMFWDEKVLKNALKEGVGPLKGRVKR